MSETRILVVDDEEIARQNLMHVLRREGWEVDCAADAQQAMEYLREHDYRLVLTDIRMPGMDGLALLRQIRALSPNTEVIVITAHASAGSAVEAMRAGAFFYIEKPFRIADVRKIVQEALEKCRLKIENTALKQELAQTRGARQIIASSEVMHRLLETAMRIAPTDCTVLIHGETGTGKELLARYVHDCSDRAAGPFIAINCGVLSEELLANELFGHERGAFTGAATAKAGLLEVAEGGTLFLDEVTEMPPSIQVKFLRVLQEREFFRLGGTQAIKANLRILAASNRNPEASVKAGVLRQDLYFRLNVVGLTIPSLRERKDDIPLLATHFITTHAQRMGRSLPGLTPAALKLMMAYDYPGNIRELENIIERAIALCATSLIDQDLLPANLHEAQGSDLAASDAVVLPTLAQLEQAHIQKVLSHCNGNKYQAAKMLGIDRVSLWRKLKSCGE